MGRRLERPQGLSTLLGGRLLIDRADGADHEAEDHRGLVTSGDVVMITIPARGSETFEMGMQADECG